MWCAGCMGDALPFAGIVGEGDFKGALREYRGGLGSRAADFVDLRFDPFDREVGAVLKEVDTTLRGCAYLGGDEVGGRLREMATRGGCALSLLFHNIRSVKGPGLELLEVEMKRWGVRWDVIGLAETWLDEESEKTVAVEGYGLVCASRSAGRGGGVALLVKDGLTYRERPDLGTFDEGEFESVFIEIVRGGGRRNDVIGAVYRPPGGSIQGFNVKMARILARLRGVEGYVMGDFNVDLIKTGTHGPTSDYLEGFTSLGFYPLISLPTRMAFRRNDDGDEDGTATLIDNIWTNNVGAEVRSGLVTVRISDHLPAFALVAGEREVPTVGGCGGGKRRLMNEGRIARFAEELEGWSFDEEREVGAEGNVGRFRNEFRDLYDVAFPWVEDKRSRKDVEKPWLDDAEFKELVREKSELYSRKIKGGLGEEEEGRLDKVTRAVNRTRQRLKRAHFAQKLGETKGDLKATWGVLGEALRGRRGLSTGATCGYFNKDGVGVTDKGQIVNGFCDFYCKVGPKLAARLGKERDGAFLEYMGERVEETLIWRPTTPGEVEELCGGLEPDKGQGWDGVSPRVIKGVARELSGSLSRLFNCCIRGGVLPRMFQGGKGGPRI